MNQIITIGREFGSGGRELGRRLSEELKVAYYDQEIVTEIAKRTALSEQYVHMILERRPITSFPIHTGRTFYPSVNPVLEQTHKVFHEQSRILREMAEQSDCVIVGRCADYILRDLKPFRLFVYADMESKMERCRRKAPEQEKLTDRDLKKQILEVDKHRASYYNFYTGQKWGDRICYDLCINTARGNIKEWSHVLSNLFLK